MSKKLVLLIVLVLGVSFALTACGSKKDKSSKTVKLPQTFSSATGLTVKYPEGWIARDDAQSGNVEIATKLEVLDITKAGGAVPTGDFVLVINATPKTQTSMAGKTAAEILKSLNDTVSSTLGSSSGITFGDITSIKIGGKDGARCTVTNAKTESESLVVVFKFDNDTLVSLGGMVHQGELGQYEATLLKMAESVTYQVPPATPTPTETPTAAPTPTAVTLVEIVIAVTNIKAGTVIGETSVGLSTRLLSDLPEGGIYDMSDVVGKVAKVDLHREDPVLAQDLGDAPPTAVPSPTTAYFYLFAAVIDIPAGTVISEDAVSITPSLLFPEGSTFNPANVIGRMTKVDIHQGDLILLQNLEDVPPTAVPPTTAP